MYKPPRSHYDSVSGKLVLNLDHFCPWVANTVGFYNRKFFILFLTYTWLTCTYCFVVLYYALIRKALWLRPDLIDQSIQIPPSMMIAAYMAVIFDAVFAVALFLFGGLHWYLALRNQTSVEGYDRSQKYDLGYRRNLETVFGRNRLYWLLPVYHEGPVGDGVHWETVHGNIDGMVPDEEAVDDEQYSENMSLVKNEGNEGIEMKETHSRDLDPLHHTKLPRDIDDVC